MAKIEKVISVTEFEQGSIYVDSGELTDSTTGLRAINILSLDGYKKFFVNATDSSGNALKFSFACYNNKGKFDSAAHSVALGWKDSGTEIDLTDYSTITGIKILLSSENNITPNDLGSCQITLILESEWVIDNSYPYLENIDELIEVMLEPYPNSLMIKEENEYPKYSHLNLIAFIQEPYPLALPIMKENEYPHYTHLNPIDTGAFCWATNLEKVIIPESCKYIGVTAFRHTKLKEVTIAKDCVYFDTSFPDSCEIKFYE